MFQRRLVATAAAGSRRCASNGILVDPEKALGVHMADQAGKRFLDLSGTAALAPLGHNHPRLLDLLKPGAGLTQVDAAFIMSRLAPAPEGLFEWSVFLGSGVEKALELASKLRVRTRRPGSAAGLDCEVFHVSERLRANAGGEPACLEEAAATLKEGRVSTVVAEPFDWASDSFFRSLRQLARDSGAVFVVDETESCMGMGRVWAHDQWELADPADLVLFGSRFQASGVYAQQPSFFFMDTKPGMRDHCPNIWVVDPMALCRLQAIRDVIEEEQLFDRSAQVGRRLRDGLHRLAAKFPPIVSRPRGRGSMLAFDAGEGGETGDMAPQVAARLRERGVLVSWVGERTVGLTPSLVFEEQHADQALGALEDVCTSLSPS